MHIFAWSPNPYAAKYRRRPMVTPVHRFQQIESMLIDPRGRFDGTHGICGRGRRWVNRPRMPRPPENFEINRSSLPQMSTSTPAHIPQERVAADPESLAVVPPPRNTLPDNFNRFRMGSINWGLWACFVVITALLLPAHIYLKQFAYRGEFMGVFFVITLLFLVCFSVSMFHTKTRAILLHRLHLEEELRAFPPGLTSSSHYHDRRLQSSSASSQNHLRESRHGVRPLRASRSTPDLQLNGSTRIDMENDNRHNNSHRVIRSLSQASRASDVSPIWDPLGEPPPYELAILLPTPSPDGLTRTCETPPPAYDIIQ